MAKKSNVPGKKEDLVLTPGGARPRNHVHSVAPGEAVRLGKQDKAVIIPAKEASVAAGIGSLAANLVLTPGGFRHPSLVHRVEPGQAVHLAAGRLRLMNLKTKAFIEVSKASVGAEEVPGLGTGWIAYAYWINGTGSPITSFSTTWRVPPAPATQASQTIFLFNGIDPSDPSSGILQPVLQWGPSAAGGGAYWSIASWYVTGDGHAFYTTPVPVNVGDTLVGVMTLTSRAGNLFNYQCEFQGIAGTSLPVQNLPELVWCNETLEAYSLNACSDYPDTDYTAFQTISLQTGNTTPSVNWTPVNQVVDCGQHANVVSNSATDGEVDIFYRPQRVVRIPLDRFAEYVRILFGVTNDGGGIVILPNGQIIHIPPGGPGDGNPIFRQVAAGITEVARGLAAHELTKDSPNGTARKAIARAAREMTVKGLEEALQAIKKGVTGP